MGFADGDRVPWTRWWFPAGTEPAMLEDGILPDPSNPYFRYLNPRASTLEAHQERSVIVLLADAGMGKSYELEAETQRLQTLGQQVELVDLGEYLDATEVRSAIQEAVGRWQRSGTERLTLALDGFDEPLFSIRNLSDVLKRELTALDPSRARVMIASRSSLWSVALGDTVSAWSKNQAVTLMLGPLSEDQIRVAAGTDLDDTGAVMANIRAAGIGPLAARPITLRLLLSAAAAAGLPDRRSEVYRLGVEGLVEENNARRQERRLDGPPLQSRLAAARRLAVATLLTGRMRVVRRSRASDAGHSVALDQLTTHSVSLLDLEAVFDSALLSNDGEARRWTHRSIEEYLCALQLSELPLQSAVSLLTDPSAPSELLPQLADTAAWLAAFNEDWLDWVVQRRPDILINPDLRSRDEEQRRRIGSTLFARISSGDVPADRLIYDGLSYDGLAEDLAPLLASTQPAWMRREALRIIANTKLRALDSQLVEMVETVATNYGPDDYNNEVQVAAFAANALRACDDTPLLARGKAVTVDPSAPRALRMGLIEWLWPAHTSTSDLLAAVPPDDRISNRPGFGARLTRLLEGAVRRGRVAPDEMLGWFDGLPPAAHYDHKLAQLAGAVVLGVLTTVEPGTPAWSRAISLALQNQHGTGNMFGWTQTELDDLDDDRRRVFARDLVIGHQHLVDPVQLVDRSIVRPDDLAWWLNELAREIDSGEHAASTARSVVEQLAWVVPDHDAAVTAARAATAHPALVPIVDTIFGDVAIAGRARAREEATAERQQRETRSAQERFSVDRLTIALDADDFPAAVHEMERQLTPGAPAGAPPFNVLRRLDNDQRQRVADVAARYLRQPHLDAADADTLSCIVAAHDILEAEDPSALETIPREHWTEWLPHLLATPGVYTAVTTAVHRRADAADECTDEALITQLRSEVALGQVGLVYQLRGYRSPALSRAALELADDNDVDPRVLAALLKIADGCLPTEAAATAAGHLRAGPQRSADQIRNASSTEDSPSTPAFTRAATAAAALMRMQALPATFVELLDAFGQDNRLAISAIGDFYQFDAAPAWHTLSPTQLAELYLWARNSLPPAPHVPSGTVYAQNPVSGFPDQILQAIVELPDATAAAEILDHLAVVTDDVWLGRAARTGRDAVRAAAWRPPMVAAVLAVLDEPSLRVVTTVEQLAEVVLAELDALAKDLGADRALRAQLWHRQRRSGQWDGYAPLSEPELSDRLARELERRLWRRRIAVLREVEIQPRLSDTGGDVPDLLAVAVRTDADTATLPMEVKGNWNDGMLTNIETQLGERYLRGPHGSTGVYVVGYYSGDAWTDDDQRRRGDARRHSREAVVADLEARSQALADRGINAHVRVLDLHLERSPEDEPEADPQDLGVDDGPAA